MRKKKMKEQELIDLVTPVEREQELIDLVMPVEREQELIDLVTPVEREQELIDLVTPVEREQEPIDLVEPMERELVELVTPIEMMQQIKESKRGDVNSRKENTLLREHEGKKTINYVNTEGAEDEQTIGNFKLHIFKRVQEVEEREDGVSVRTFYLCKISLKSGEVFEAKVPGGQIANLNWIIEQTGGAAYLSIGKETRQNVIKQIHDQIDSNVIEPEICFRQNGWKYVNGKWGYVIHDGMIGGQKKGVYGDIQHPFPYNPKMIGTRTNFCEVLGMMEICNEKSITIPLFLFTHLGVLTKLFELAKFPPKMVMAIIGPTNSRKTSMALCMTKTFGREDITMPEISFDSTPGGIEVRSSRHADSVILVDDYHPASTTKEKSKLDGNLTFVLRRYGDRTSVKRMTDFMSNRDVGQYPVTGVCLITGEDIGGVQSSLTRTLCLNVTKQSVRNERLTYFQENYETLNSHLYSFLQFVTQNFDEIVNMIANDVKCIRAKRRYPILRFSEYFAEFITVAKIFGWYAKTKKFWDDKQVELWIQECERQMEVVVEQNLRGVMIEDYGVMVMKALQGTIDEYGCGELNSFHGNRITGKQILFDEEFYYVTTEFLLEETRRYWLKYGRTMPFTSTKQMTQFLMDRELILVKKEGKDTRRTLPLPGRKQRVLYISKEKMHETLKQVEW